MTDENGRPSDEGQPPEQVLTVNQVVAWNLAFFRRAAGLTQVQFATMVGWTKSALSDAERSVSGKWTREFDAHTLVNFAEALEIPVGAFFLPPEDDGIKVTYYTELPGAGDCPALLDMAGLLTRILPDSGSVSPAMTAYRDRLRSQAARYLDPYWHSQVVQLLDDAGVLPKSPELRADIAGALRHYRDQDLARAALMGRWADAIEKDGDQ